MWVDLLVENLLKRSPGPHVINDAKTPSGHVTVAHLRGVLMHECISRALRDKDVETIQGVQSFRPWLGDTVVMIDARRPNLENFPERNHMPVEALARMEALARDLMAGGR